MAIIEYGLVLVLISVILITALTSLGNYITRNFNYTNAAVTGVNDSLSGNNKPSDAGASTPSKANQNPDEDPKVVEDQ